MTGTLTALILGLAIEFRSLTPTPLVVTLLGIVVGTLLLVSLAPVNIFAWSPLQDAEKNSTPRVVELFSKDVHIKVSNALLLMWGVASWLMPLVAESHSYFFVGWLVLTGVVLDLHIHACRRVLKYLNPFAVLEMMADEGAREVRAKQDVELSQWIESISEISQNALQNSSSSLSTAGLAAIQKILHEYLLYHRLRLGSADSSSDSHQRASYILYYAFERMQNLFIKALEAHNEPMCSGIISTLGKITLDCASVNLSFVPHPVHFIGTFAKMATQAGMETVNTKARFLLVQISKLMLTERDIARVDLKRAFLAITRQLEESTKETFRQDKSVRLGELTQPLQELKTIFQSERLSSHPDAEVIVSDIDRILGDFANLELVMRALPPIPEEGDQ